MVLLERELGQLEAENVVLQMAVTDAEIRVDGWIRANARPQHPGVILTFESVHGPLSYAVETFTDWQANVRGIALALEALRKVDRYGVTKSGEQYKGWKALPAKAGTTMSARAAANVIVDLSPGWVGEFRDYSVDQVLTVRTAFKHCYRAAAKASHPDAGGSPERFQLLQQAKAVLDAHHGNGKA